MLRRAVPSRPVVIDTPPCLHIGRASPMEPWLLRHVGSDRPPWPYLGLAAAIEDARRYLAAAGGSDLVVDDGCAVTTTRVPASTPQRHHPGNVLPR